MLSTTVWYSYFLLSEKLTKRHVLVHRFVKAVEIASPAPSIATPITRIRTISIPGRHTRAVDAGKHMLLEGAGLLGC